MKIKSKFKSKLKLTLDIILLLLFGAMCNTGVTGTRFHERRP